jgi:hypothetical protein
MQTVNVKQGLMDGRALTTQQQIKPANNRLVQVADLKGRLKPKATRS